MPRRLWAAVVAAAFVVHGALWWLYYRPVPKALWGDEATYWVSATALLAGDPAWWPDPLWPPLYPRFLAGIFAVGGSRVLGVQLVQTALLVGVAILLFDLARRLSGSHVASAVAGALALAYPPLVAFAHYLWPEVLHLFLFMTALWLLVARADRAVWCGVAGVAVGLALLTKSLLGPFLPVLVVAAFARRPVAGSLLRAAVFVAAVVATVAPTALEQRQRTGRLMIADSSAFNLWVGLNDRARRNFEIDVVSGIWEEYAASAETFAERDRILRDQIRARFDSSSWPELVWRQLGRQYFRLLDKDSYLTNQLPGGFAVERYGAGYRRASRPLAGAVRLVSFASYAVLLGIAPFGLLCWRFRDRRWMRVLLLFVVYNLAIFLWLHVKTRYRVQMLPVLFVGAGAAVAALARWQEGGLPQGEVPRWRVMAAALCAALLEALAFAAPLLP